ncbi:hypothetical protein [Nocardia asiatica]|uniref:hypothetical protein n=1 Tax=Nocardia asiatica TaxID=209252 RepID=UPI00031D88D0|nr:hypothetical protein [Nocardia asiatica]
MNVEDLEWQLTHRTGVPPQIVDEILDHGALESLVEAAEVRGDWFCAQGAVHGLCAAGEFERAWTVIEPFANSGWQPAVRAGADVLLRWGRIARALELARPRNMETGTRDAWRDYAEVLAGAGRVDEAIAASSTPPSTRAATRTSCWNCSFGRAGSTTPSKRWSTPSTTSMRETSSSRR